MKRVFTPPEEIHPVRNKSLAGFTLLELLIGIAIFTIVTASVYTSLYLGIKLFKQEESRDEGLQEAVLTLDQMAKHLRCAFINPQNEGITFIGSQQQLDFFSVDSSGAIENIVFYIEPQANNDSFLLFQSGVKYVNLDNTDSADIKLINNSICSFELSYFDGKDKKWYENWPEELKLPNQVKIEISFTEAGDKKEPLQLVKYVNIPLTTEIYFSEYEAQ